MKAENIDNGNENRYSVDSSRFVAHLGNKNDFIPKISKLIDEYVTEEELVSINDGTIWIDIPDAL